MSKNIETSSKGGKFVLPLSHMEEYINFPPGNGYWQAAFPSYVEESIRFDVSGKRSQGHRGPPYKEGGPFSVRRGEVIRHDGHSNGTSSSFSGVPAYRESGRHTFNSSEFPFQTSDLASYIQDQNPGDPFYLEDDSLTYGPSGWKKFSPGRNGIRIGQDILEIRDIPKAILSLKERVRGLHSLASKHLAWEFGLKPVIKDLRDIYLLQKRLHKELSQLIRDNGRPVRRRGVVSKVNVQPSVVITHDVSSVWPGFAPGDERQVINRTQIDSSVFSKTVYSFSARFRYWVPDIGSQRWTDKAVASLYGIDLTPSLLYQVTPWSWLVDWFSNLGDIMDNLSYNAAENLVADYAFIMGSYLKIRYLTAIDEYSDGSVLSASLELRNSLKVRNPASPFGFGIKREDLNGSQLAILTSLGLQRLKF